MPQFTPEITQKERKDIISEITNNSLYGKKIYLIGSSEYGATNEPVCVNTTTEVKSMFGSKGTLYGAFCKVKSCFADNQIYLVKTTGNHSTAYFNVNINDGEVIEDGFILIATQSNELFDDTKVILTMDSLTIIHPPSLKIPDVTYSFNEYKTFMDLTRAINKDALCRKIFIRAYYSVDDYTSTANSLYSVNPDIKFLYGGLCGLNYSKDLLYNCLSKTYSILESLDIDIIVPVDAFLDDIYPDDSEEEEHTYNMKFFHPYKDYLSCNTSGKQLSFLNQLINFCLTQYNFGFITTGIIGYNCYKNVTSKYLYDSDELVEMYKACLEYNLNCCDNRHYSFLVSAVAGDLCYSKDKVIDNGYLAYAALCSYITYAAGTANIPFPDTINLYQEFSEPALQELSNNGIVAYRHSPLFNRVVVFDGTTIACFNENLKLYANVRMVQLCMAYLNKLYQFYIGKNMNELIDLDIFKKDSNEILSILASKNILLSYKLDIKPNYKNSEIKVFLELQTLYMIKSVYLYSSFMLRLKNPDEV